MNKLIVLVLAAFLAACSAKTSLVLVPDADGHVGVIQAVGDGGAVVLDKPLTGTSAAKGERPAEPEQLTRDKVDRVWGAALSAMPTIPATLQLYFRTGSSELKDESAALLPQVVKEAASRPYPVIYVAGHADSVGSDAINNKIARDRADVVRDRLLLLGLKKDDIRVSSHGKRNPLVAVPDGVAEPRNRRVTVTIQ